MKRKITIILILISILLIGINNVQASTKTYDRNELENYGVKKDFEITSKNKTNVLNTPAVDASEKIYDYADVLTEQEEKVLKEKIDEFINETKMDMVIVIPDFYYNSDSQNETYAADFFDYNDFGMEFENTSGVLFLRNAYESDPYFNIYTFGNAQLYFDYNRLENTLDYIYPDIKDKNYLTGFTNFITRMINDYKQGIPDSMKDYEVNEKGYIVDKNGKVMTANDYKNETRKKIDLVGILLASILITAIVMFILIRKNKMVLKATRATEYLNKNLTSITTRKDKFIRSHTTSYTTSSDDDRGDFSSSSGGGFSSSGSSGGGHSSGGGRHG